MYLNHLIITESSDFNFCDLLSDLIHIKYKKISKVKIGLLYFYLIYIILFINLFTTLICIIEYVKYNMI